MRESQIPWSHTLRESHMLVNTELLIIGPSSAMKNYHLLPNLRNTRKRPTNDIYPDSKVPTLFSTFHWYSWSWTKDNSLSLHRRKGAPHKSEIDIHHQASYKLRATMSKSLVAPTMSAEEFKSSSKTKGIALGYVESALLLWYIDIEFQVESWHAEQEYHSSRFLNSIV